MKKIFIALCILGMMVGCQSSEWELVWMEDFDQKDGFDEKVWTKIPRGKSDWNNYMSDFDSC